MNELPLPRLEKRLAELSEKLDMILGLLEKLSNRDRCNCEAVIKAAEQGKEYSWFCPAHGWQCYP